MRQRTKRVFRTKHFQIIPARTHIGRTVTGRASVMITLADRLAFREKVHIGDRVRFRDSGLVNQNCGENCPKDGVIAEMYPHIVVVQCREYKTAFTYDQMMLHDNIYLVGDDDYIVREVSSWGQ